MIHTFDQIRTRTPADPKTAPEAVMPQAAREALLRDAVQDLHPPLHPRNPPQVAPDHPAPGMGHRRPTGLATTPPPAHREGKGQGEGPRQGGEERPTVAGRRPQGQVTGGNATRGQGTTGGPGKG